MTDIQKPDAPDEDIDARIACVLAEYEAHDRRSAALFPANKAALFDALGAAGITTVTVTFDGYGDSGQIEEITAQQGDRVVDLPASTPHDPSHWVPEEKKREVFETGLLTEGLPGPPEIMPTETRGEREEAEGLRAAIAHYRASPGPVIPHRFFGPLTRDEWDHLQLIHFAHHLSFAVPTAG